MNDDDSARSETDDSARSDRNERSPPLTDLADRIRTRRHEPDEGSSSTDRARTAADRESTAAGRKPTADIEDDHFESVESVPIDEDAVWEQLASESARDDRDELPGDADEAVVDKHAFCQRCEYFTDPPETACNHEGTTILEVVDRTQFRVQGCPMVERGGPGAAPNS